MSRERDLLENAVFIGGVPRSGTTFLARSLNSHPGFVLSADDHVLECWRLYYYRSRTGIVDGLRRGALSGNETLAALMKHLFRDGSLVRAVPSDKVLSFPRSASPARPDGTYSDSDGELERHDVPLASFSPSWRLCLKSPEITYVLDDLAALLPSARFIMAYRPLAEVAESMYRMGEKVKKVKIFHRRWRDEKDEHGRLVAPPGIPSEWAELWPGVTDFQRCVINGASYLRALTEQVERHENGRVFVYSHRTLQQNPKRFFPALANFLQVREVGFRAAADKVVGSAAFLPPHFAGSYDSMGKILGAEEIEGRLLAVTSFA